MSALRLETPRLVLTLPPESAAPRVLAYLEANRAHHAPSHPSRAPAFYTETFWRDRLARNLVDHASDTGLWLGIFGKHAPDGPMLGLCTFTQFARGPAQSCTLGYSLDTASVGKGLMHEALTCAIAHVFGPLRMHRIMANHLPENDRSARVLKRLNFVQEGYARNYLYIDGAWRDHVLNALTNPDPTPPA